MLSLSRRAVSDAHLPASDFQVPNVARVGAFELVHLEVWFKSPLQRLFSTAAQIDLHVQAKCADGSDEEAGIGRPRGIIGEEPRCWKCLGAGAASVLPS